MSLFLANSRFTKRTYLMNAYASKGVIKESGQAYDATHLWLMAPHKIQVGRSALDMKQLNGATHQTMTASVISISCQPDR